MNFKGTTALYLDKGIVHKVEVCHCMDDGDKLILTLNPLGDVHARENEDDEMEYHSGSHFQKPFEFGGEKAGISLHKNILSVPYCGSLNLNEFAVRHFDKREPDFNLLWYNIDPDEE